MKKEKFCKHCGKLFVTVSDDPVCPECFNDILFDALNPDQAPIDARSLLAKAGAEDLNPENVSDGYHTFKDLYNQRLHLTAALVDAYPFRCWKSKMDEHGQPWFGGDWFLVCIETPAGQFSYHYEMKHWDMFHCMSLERARHFDGHTSKDVGRLDSLWCNLV